MDIEYIQEYQVGRYSIDFYIPSTKTCLEADGAYWHSIKKIRDRDNRRDAFLKRLGYKVFRMPEEDINRSVTQTLVPILEGETIGADGTIE